MAFFKFRLPGAAAAAQADGLSATQSEGVEGLRRRARHRLLGAVVLVCVAVVAFALLFSAKPRAVPAAVPLVIQDRHAAAASALDNSMAPSVTAREPSVSQTPALPPMAESQPQLVQRAASAAAVAQAPAPGVQHSASTAAKPKTEPAAAAAAAPAAVAAPVADAHKAQALLDGRASQPTAARWVVQAGAFVDTAKAKEVRRKLERAGLKTYTQVIDDKEGRRTVRVRLGPFESRAEADKAAARVHKLDVQANVLAL